MKYDLVGAYNKLKTTDKRIVDMVLRRPTLKKILEEKVKDIFDKDVKLSSHDMNVLTNIFINTRQSFETILRFINENPTIKKLDGNLIDKTTSKNISRDLFYFTPTIGKNPMGNGEFLLAFYFNNVKKRHNSGDLLVGKRKYELKSSRDGRSGGGKVNSTKEGVYGIPDSVSSHIMRLIPELPDKNILNFNYKNFKRISSLKVDHSSIFNMMMTGIYPKIKSDHLLSLGKIYERAIKSPSKIISDEFKLKYARFQLEYYLDNHDERLLFINRESGNMLEIRRGFTDEVFNKVKFLPTVAMGSKTNNVYQFSID